MKYIKRTLNDLYICPSCGKFIEYSDNKCLKCSLQVLEITCKDCNIKWKRIKNIIKIIKNEIL